MCLGKTQLSKGNILTSLNLKSALENQCTGSASCLHHGKWSIGLVLALLFGV